MPSPRRRTRALLAAALLPILLLTACGEDESEETPAGGAAVGEACQAAADCSTGLLCIGLICRDPNDTPSNNTNNPNNNQNNNTNNVNNNTNSVNNNTNNPEDAGDNNPLPDAAEDTSAEDDAASGEDVAPDAPAVERPDTLTGGVSIFEAHVRANNLLQIHRGNAGAAFVPPGAEENPTLDACATFQATTSTPPTPGYSAGEITVTGGSRTIVLTPSNAAAGSILYSANLDEDNEDAYGNGATLTISAAGSDHIPAFSGSVVAPGDHNVTAPAPDSAFSGAINVAWSGSGSDASVVINMIPLNAAFTPINGLGINCPLSADSGSFAIPAELTSQLTAPRYALSVIRVRNTTVTVGPDTFILNATYSSGVIVKQP